MGRSLAKGPFVDDHLMNHGFLHVDRGLWRLAPAFDINPFPERLRELKTWVSGEVGPEAPIDARLSVLPYFAIPRPRAMEMLARGQQAPGPGRPEWGQRWSAAPGRRQDRRSRDRELRRIEREVRRFGADPRFLARARNSAIHPADAIDSVPPPGLRRRNADVARQGDRERSCHRGTGPDLWAKEGTVDPKGKRKRGIPLST